MVDSIPRLLVAGPTITPVPYGLLSVAQLVDDTDPHWRSGVEYDVAPCDAAAVTEGNCGAVGDEKTATTTGRTTGCADAFTVYARVDCSTVGSYDGSVAAVSQALQNGEGRAAERRFWTADLASDAATGCGDAADVISSSATDLVEAIGLLEGQLGICYGGLGVIHVPRWALAKLAAESQLTSAGGRLKTIGGTLIAAGAGYSNTSPSGDTPAAGTSWLYATGGITARRSPVQVTSSAQQSVNRSNNSQVLIAERTYAIGWDCCHLATLATIGTVTPSLVI